MLLTDRPVRTSLDEGPPTPAAQRGALGLPGRLLALILLCLLPVVAAETYTNIDLRAQRRTELGDLARRQAELVDHDMGSLIGNTEHLLRLAGLSPNVRALDPACGGDLARLQAELPEYRFVAVLDAARRIVCSSLPDVPALGAGTVPAWTDGWETAVPAAEGGAVVGDFAVLPGVGPVLPIARALHSPNGAGGTIVAALDLHWLSAHLATLWHGRTPLSPRSSVIVTDMAGVVLARYPDGDAWIGRALPPAVRPMIQGSKPGVGFLELGGTNHLVAYEPVGVSPVGIAALIVAGGVDVTPGLGATGLREILLVAGASLLAIALTVIAGRRFFVRPIDRLLQAAQRWRDGDLTARAELGEKGSEFGRLAASFNEMAQALQVRDAELRMQADMLEAQVEARTRDLSETNNRLQVEIAEREKTEAALLQAQKLQAVGQLAGGIAHDFNNMLATILGSLELMERRLQRASAGQDTEETERLRGLIERATDAVQRGAQLTARLLAFSRRQLLMARPTDLNRLIGDLVTLAASTLGRRVRVRTDLAADLWPALADPAQVEAAILNLCLNARDAMPDGGELTIATGRERVPERSADGLAAGDYVRVSVRDTGCGMPPDVLARAFEPFFTTKGPSGTGLGLSQVYGLARQSDGTVRISSTPGEGTEVVLLLPRARDAAESADRPRDRAAASPPMPRLAVLVVDDDAAVRHVAVEMLVALGCEVMQAGGAEEALHLLDTTEGIGLLLIDYVMPGMNGLDLAREVRRRGIGIPMVLETGYAELGEGAEADASLLEAVLHKPFTIRELQSMLLRVHGARVAQGNVVPLRGAMHG
ncbi:MAG: response regulator [Proteobacteria bacterium]|nr:response regulator [Pseudomonadota bacterium]